MILPPGLQRYQVGDSVFVVWTDRLQLGHQSRRAGQVISMFHAAGTWRYRVRLQDGRTILCTSYQLRPDRSALEGGDRDEHRSPL